MDLGNTKVIFKVVRTECAKDNSDKVRKQSVHGFESREDVVLKFTRPYEQTVFSQE